MLQRRLFASYFGAFALVIIIFAAGVELSFLSIVRQQATNRLANLARAGAAAVFFTPRGFIVDENSLGGFDVDPATEGLEWFDRAKHLSTHRGREPLKRLAPSVGTDSLVDASGRTLEAYTLVLRDQQGNERGYVRALLTSDAFYHGIGALNVGIVIGSLLAIVAASVGGTFLARAAIARTEAGYRQLQEFTADASHELRNPLTAVSTTAAVALHEAPEMAENTRRRLVAISSAAKDMQRIVEDLLLLARAGRSLEREMFIVRVDAVVRDVHNRYQSAAALKSLDFQLSLNGPSQIIGNPEQVTRIVANLVENAIRYTPKGGVVRMACTDDHTGVRVVVEDTGIGIAPEDREKIFERFWRAGKRADGGSGLGLSIARALAERHGGRISVTSATNSGSTFTLTLPHRPSNVS